ncbi:MAG TPA: hypothetical protein VF930_13010 [Stellaceae bacterium]
MILIGRIIAVLLLIGAALVTLQDAIGWYTTGVFEPTVVGTLWHKYSPNTLLLAQPAIQRHVSPWLWDNVIIHVLLFWAAPTLAVPALILLWQTRGRRRRGTRLD